MTTKVFTIRMDKKLLAVDEIMGWAHVRHVPVVDAQGKLAGLLSQRDVLRSTLSDLASTPVDRRNQLGHVSLADVMRREVLTVGPGESVQAAARLMRQHKYGCLPVVEDGRVVGIITEHDLLEVVERLSPDGSYSGRRT
ncbi:MAG TPA: CBS domain-containing protein [Gemmatimonadales bacterium]|nr:CBS domain-containing protein [Gemmatimonadales bacterium]